MSLSSGDCDVNPILGVKALVNYTPAHTDGGPSTNSPGLQGSPSASEITPRGADLMVPITIRSTFLVLLSPLHPPPSPLACSRHIQSLSCSLEPCFLANEHTTLHPVQRECVEKNTPFCLADFSSRFSPRPHFSTWVLRFL